MNVYISGALKASRDLQAARRMYEWAAACVVECGHQAYVPHLHTDPVKAAHVKPGSVYETDATRLRQADAIVAFLDEPSLGVGAELAMAVASGLPVLGLHRSDIEVSRFAVGMLLQHRNRVVAYVTMEDVRREVRLFTASLRTMVAAE